MAASYTEQAPPSGLEPWVACSWLRVADQQSDGVDEQVVLPDGCLDLLWYGGQLVVAGPDSGPMVSRPSPRGDVAVGVRFRTGAAPALLGEAASRLRDRRVTADELWGRRGARLAERVAAADGRSARLALLLDEVRTRAADAPVADQVVAEAVDVLARGSSSVAALATRLAISERQLRRRFDDHVGYGPKTLDRVLRLQRFLDALSSGRTDLARLSLELGYADQPHLSREARALTGQTARALVASWGPRPLDADEPG